MNNSPEPSSPPDQQMREPLQYHVLATDYDSTLAFGGVVEPAVWDALRLLKAADVSLILVTGRHLPEILSLLGPTKDLFRIVIAENGGLQYDPITDNTTYLVPPFPQSLATALKKQHIVPLSIGQTMCASWEGWADKMLRTCKQLHLDMTLEYNRGSIMLLPTGTDKATGLRAALKTLDISPGHCLAVGDGENDVVFLRAAGCGAAVENACKELKAVADIVLKQKKSQGISVLVELFLSNQLPRRTPTES